MRRFLPALHRLYDAVFFCPKARGRRRQRPRHRRRLRAVQACADRRIAAAGSARIGVAELLVGVPLPPLAFEIMRFATPPRYLADGLYSGATFTPDVALARGLIDQVVEPAALLDRAVAAAETLGRVAAGDLCADQRPDPPERHRCRGAPWRPRRRRLGGNLGIGHHARPYPRLRRPHFEEELAALANVGFPADSDRKATSIGPASAPNAVPAGMSHGGTGQTLELQMPTCSRTKQPTPRSSDELEPYGSQAR